MRISLVIILPCVLSSASVIATEVLAPSFNCQQAQGQVEELICQDSQLASLDIQLNNVFNKLKNQVSQTEFAQIKPIQRGWIKGRNDCWKAEAVKECAIEAYSSRITELQIAAGEFDVPEAVQYECGVAENNTLTKITAYFYNKTTIPAAILTISPTSSYLKATNIAFLSRSASGAKYQGQNFSFWTHQTEATLTQYDQADLSCTSK